MDEKTWLKILHDIQKSGEIKAVYVDARSLDAEVIHRIDKLVPTIVKSGIIEFTISVTVVSND